MLSMNIRFDAFMIELLLVGMPWPEWYERYKPTLQRWFAPEHIPV